MSEIVFTRDGSHTIYVKELDEHYHSTHGAIAESMHVFIEAGLRSIKKKYIRILEMGFGTGLNAYLSLMDTKSTATEIHYTGIEKFPLPRELIETLNYPEFFPCENIENFLKLHDCPWNEPISIRNDFILTKIDGDIRTISLTDQTDIVFYDAFGPGKQPELWTKEIFRKIFLAMSPGGLLTTYTVKGEVRRAMSTAGFRVEKLPGPPGKREMLRAYKNL